MGIFGGSRADARKDAANDPAHGGEHDDPVRDTRPEAAPAADRMLQPLTNELIIQALSSLGLKYFTDSDGDVGATWEDFIVYFFRMGEQDEILNSRVVVHRKFPVGDVLRLQTFSNDWNREKLWPKVYVRVAEQDGRPVEAQLIGEVITDLEFGVAPVQLRQLISCAIGTGSSLASSVQALRSL